VVIAVDLNKCKVDEPISDPSLNHKEKEGGADLKSEEEQEREDQLLRVMEEKYREITGSIQGWFDSIKKDPVPNILEIIDNTINIMQKSITESQFKVARPDIIIEPDLSGFRLFDFDRADEAIAEGYNRMKKKIPALKELLR